MPTFQWVNKYELYNRFAKLEQFIIEKFLVEALQTWFCQTGIRRLILKTWKIYRIRLLATFFKFNTRVNNVSVVLTYYVNNYTIGRSVTTNFFILDNCSHTLWQHINQCTGCKPTNNCKYRFLYFFYKYLFSFMIIIIYISSNCTKIL